MNASHTYTQSNDRNNGKVAGKKVEHIATF